MTTSLNVIHEADHKIRQARQLARIVLTLARTADDDDWIDCRDGSADLLAQLCAHLDNAANVLDEIDFQTEQEQNIKK